MIIKPIKGKNLIRELVRYRTKIVYEIREVAPQNRTQYWKSNKGREMHRSLG